MRATSVRTSLSISACRAGVTFECSVRIARQVRVAIVLVLDFMQMLRVQFISAWYHAVVEQFIAGFVAADQQNSGAPGIKGVERCGSADRRPGLAALSC